MLFLLRYALTWLDFIDILNILTKLLAPKMHFPTHILSTSDVDINTSLNSFLAGQNIEDRNKIVESCARMMYQCSRRLSKNYNCDPEDIFTSGVERLIVFLNGMKPANSSFIKSIAVNSVVLAAKDSLWQKKGFYFDSIDDQDSGIDELADPNALSPEHLLNIKQQLADFDFPDVFQQEFAGIDLDLKHKPSPTKHPGERVPAKLLSIIVDNLSDRGFATADLSFYLGVNKNTILSWCKNGKNNIGLVPKCIVDQLTDILESLDCDDHLKNTTMPGVVAGWASFHHWNEEETKANVINLLDISKKTFDRWKKGEVLPKLADLIKYDRYIILSKFNYQNLAGINGQNFCWPIFSFESAREAEKKIEDVAFQVIENAYNILLDQNAPAADRRIAADFFFGNKMLGGTIGDGETIRWQFKQLGAAIISDCSLEIDLEDWIEHWQHNILKSASAKHVLLPSLLLDELLYTIDHNASKTLGRKLSAAEYNILRHVQNYPGGEIERLVDFTVDLAGKSETMIITYSKAIQDMELVGLLSCFNNQLWLDFPTLTQYVEADQLNEEF